MFPGSSGFSLTSPFCYDIFVIYKGGRNGCMIETSARVIAPWRRYFARGLDATLYSVILMVILGLGFKIDVNENSLVLRILSTLATIGLTFALEPLFLSRFGTTLGKWVFGLYVVNGVGEHLTYEQAKERTKSVLWSGNGMYIPLYDIYRNYKCYTDNNNGWELPWEEDNYIQERDQKGLRWILYLVVTAVLVCLEFWSGYQAGEPSNRGNLTIAEFSENYNQLADFYGLSAQYRLDENGQWVEDTDPSVFYISTGDATLPLFEYTLEGETVVGIRMTAESPAGTLIVRGCNSEMQMATLAFAGAQPAFSIVPALFDDVIESLGKDIICDIQGEMNGVAISRKVDQLGYTGTTALRNARESEDAYYIAEYTMTK